MPIIRSILPFGGPVACQIFRYREDLGWISCRRIDTGTSMADRRSLPRPQRITHRIGQSRRSRRLRTAAVAIEGQSLGCYIDDDACPRPAVGHLPLPFEVRLISWIRSSGPTLRAARVSGPHPTVHCDTVEGLEAAQGQVKRRVERVACVVGRGRIAFRRPTWPPSRFDGRAPVAERKLGSRRQAWAKGRPRVSDRAWRRRA